MRSIIITREYESHSTHVALIGFVRKFNQKCKCTDDLVRHNGNKTTARNDDTNNIIIADTFPPSSYIIISWPLAQYEYISRGVPNSFRKVETRSASV